MKTEAEINEGSGLTAGEQEIADHLVKARNRYCALIDGSDRHQADRRAFADAIHTCEQILALRIARRQFPQFWL